MRVKKYKEIDKDSESQTHGNRMKENNLQSRRGKESVRLRRVLGKIYHTFTSFPLMIIKMKSLCELETLHIKRK